MAHAAGIECSRYVQASRTKLAWSLDRDDLLLNAQGWIDRRRFALLHFRGDRLRVMGALRGILFHDSNVSEAGGTRSVHLLRQGAEHNHCRLPILSNLLRPPPPRTRPVERGTVTHATKRGVHCPCPCLRMPERSRLGGGFSRELGRGYRHDAPRTRVPNCKLQRRRSPSKCSSLFWRFGGSGARHTQRGHYATPGRAHRARRSFGRERIARRRWLRCQPGRLNAIVMGDIAGLCIGAEWWRRRGFSGRRGRCLLESGGRRGHGMAGRVCT